MPDKDFLSQFSNNGKPDSFKEEERIPVRKEKKPLNVKALIIALAILLLLLIAGYFLFLAPKIEMPDFVGRTRSDVAAWVKQQGVEPGGIIFEETYDFDTDEGKIMTQSVAAGRKVKNDVKLNFMLSLGPDPTEAIKVPDLKSMTRQEVQEWISTNKLLKTKTMTAYNDEVAHDEVIDYAFTGCDEETFTRGCTLKVNVSKGPAPAGKVAVEDLVKKPYASAEAWAKQKKVELIKVEQYSDNVELDYVISQSVEAGKTIEEGDSITVVVSLGKAVFMPNMVGWSKKQVDAWVRKNPSVYLDMSTVQYSSAAKDTVLSQSKKSGALIEPEDVVELTMSLGNIVDLPGSFVGQPYHAAGGLHDWKDEQNELGANIEIKRIKEFSDTVPAGCIISHDNGVPVGGTLKVYISRGRNILLEDMTGADGSLLRWTDLEAGNMTEQQARELCDAFSVTYEIDYAYRSDKANGDVIKAVRWDNKPIKAGTYLPEDITVYITVSDDSYKN